MALTDEGKGNGFFMPVAPAYGGNGNGGWGFGGDGAWLLLFLLCMGNGMWGGFGGSMWPMMMGMGGCGGWGMDYLYPWLNNSQHISDGFRDQNLNTQISDARTDINRGFGDIQLGIAGVNQNICQTGNGITQAINSGFSGAEIAANGRQMANMQQLFGLQTQAADCCCKTQTGIADLKYTIATENCADRQVISDGIRDVIANNTAQTQTILDKLCQLELDGYKRENDSLRSQLSDAKIAASQTAQNAFIAQGLNQEVDALYNRLSNCPVPTTPVYGRTPIFTCNNNSGCGCGNGFAN